jgi:branched-chain amino acid transport system substrate-binding protein
MKGTWSSSWVGRRAAVGASMLAAASMMVAVIGAAMDGTAGAAASKTPIKVGIIATLTGNAAPNATQEVDGWRLGIKKFGSEVDGHKIETYVEDSNSTPSAGLTKAKYLINTVKADVLEGPIVSSVTSAVELYAGPLHIPFNQLTLCAITQLAENGEFHNGLSSTWVCNTGSIVAAEYMYKDLGYHHVTLMGMNYSFGWEALGGFIQEFTHLGGKIDKLIWNPLATADMTPYVAQIPANTQAVYVLEGGNDAPLLAKAYEGLGLHNRIPLFGATVFYDYSVLGAEPRTAVMGGEMIAQYCDGVKNAANDSFTSAYFAAYHTYPGYYGESGYVDAELLVAAMKKLHGVATDHKAVASALVSTSIKAPRGPVSLDKKVLGPVQNQYLCKVETVNGKLEDVPIRTFANVKPWGPLSYDSWLKAFTSDSTSPPSP